MFNGAGQGLISVQAWPKWHCILAFVSHIHVYIAFTCKEINEQTVFVPSSTESKCHKSLQNTNESYICCNALLSHHMKGYYPYSVPPSLSAPISQPMRPMLTMAGWGDEWSLTSTYYYHNYATTPYSQPVHSCLFVYHSIIICTWHIFQGYQADYWHQP